MGHIPDTEPRRTPVSPAGQPLSLPARARAAPGVLVALLTLTACQPRPHRLAGDYRSTWGGCRVQVSGQDAVVRYPRGVMTCRLDPGEGGAVSPRCEWRSGEARGKARFRVEPDGRWQGTWGHGERDDDGGAWAMTR